MSSSQSASANFADASVNMLPEKPVAEYDEAKAIEEASQRAHECSHRTLYFASGGYYVCCRECSGVWVAKRGWSDDTNLDYSRAANIVSTADERVPKETP